MSQKKFRDEEGLFIAEGPKILDELLEAPNIEMLEIFALQEWAESMSPANRKKCENQIHILKPSDLERISFLSTPNQVLAIVRKPVFPAFSPKGLTLLLDGIQDPGNLGTIVRCADWFGLQQVVCSPESADVFGQKAVQSTMGSVARVSVTYTGLAEFISLFPQIPVYAAALGGENLFEIRKPENGFLLIGNESRGLTPALLKLARHRIRIPGKGRAESLNAAVATGILLAYLT